MNPHKKSLFVAGLAALFAAAGLTQSQRERSAAGTAQTITAIEHDWFDAMKEGDTAKLAEILADDWVTLGPDGARLTKAEELDSFKSGESKISSYEMGPVDVKVFGTLAVAQGSDTQKSSKREKTRAANGSGWMSS